MYSLDYIIAYIVYKLNTVVDNTTTFFDNTWCTTRTKLMENMGYTITVHHYTLIALLVACLLILRLTYIINRDLSYNIKHLQAENTQIITAVQSELEDHDNELDDFYNYQEDFDTKLDNIIRDFVNCDKEIRKIRKLNNTDMRNLYRNMKALKTTLRNDLKEINRKLQLLQQSQSVDYFTNNPNASTPANKKQKTNDAKLQTDMRGLCLTKIEPLN